MAKNKLKGLSAAKGREVEEEEVDADVGFGARLRSVRDRLKLGPHHKMERFTIMLSATMAFLLLFTVVSFASNRVALSSQATTQALISEDFAFSLSGQSGTINGVYGDKDRTDVMVLFQLTDPKGMSADANNYELFITGEKDSMAYEPNVSFALFGSTGYGVLRFEHDAGLANEVLKVTIRSNADLVRGDGPAGEIPDESFAEYDQAQLFVNPGAEGVTVLDNLKAGEKAPEKLYTALVAEGLDAEIRTRIDETTGELAQLLNRSEEYKNRLVSAGYKPPETPWFVEGDYVDQDGVFHAAKYLSKGHAVDYAEYSIRDGYINQVADGLADFDEYVATINATAETTAAKAEQMSEQVETFKTLEREDGSTLDLETIVTGTSPSAQIAAKDSVDSLMTAWRSYVTEKGKLQRGLMMELLVLDADVLSQPSMYSENTNDKMVTFY